MSCIVCVVPPIDLGLGLTLECKVVARPNASEWLLSHPRPWHTWPSKTWTNLFMRDASFVMNLLVRCVFCIALMAGSLNIRHAQHTMHLRPLP